MSQLGATHVFAVFVTPQGLFYADTSGTRDYKRLVFWHGQHEIGHYNKRIDPEYLLQDVMDAIAKLEET